MTEKFTTLVIKLYNNMFETSSRPYYDTSLMLSLKDVVPNDRAYAKKYLIKSDIAPKGKLRNLYHTQCNSSLTRKIFNYTLKIILWEIAAGKCSFTWPNNSASKIYMGWLDDKIVQQKAKLDKIPYINLIQTDYKVPYITFEFSKSEKKVPLKIYVNKEMYKAAILHANTGQKFSQRPRTINYFLPYIYDEFAYIKQESLKALILDCFSKVLWCLKQGEEIRILDSEGEIRFFRPLGRIHDKVMSNVVKKRIEKEHREKHEKFFV
jgi:hypothetical protein